MVTVAITEFFFPSFVESCAVWRDEVPHDIAVLVPVTQLKIDLPTSFTIHPAGKDYPEASIVQLSLVQPGVHELWISVRSYPIARRSFVIRTAPACVTV